MFSKRVLRFYPIGLWLFLSWALPIEMATAQGSKLRSFDHCVDGVATEAEAQQVGEVIGQRLYQLSFDSSIFPQSCTEKIAPHVYSDFNEGPSFQILRFFWSNAFFDRLLKATISNTHDLGCDLSCVLILDRRPLPDLSLFHAIAALKEGFSVPQKAILLARTSLIEDRLSPNGISDLVGALRDQELENEVIKSLYLVEDASDLSGVFKQVDEQLCLANRCIRVPDVDDHMDCEQFRERLSNEKSLDKIVALKHWALNSGRSTIYGCIEHAFGESIEKAEQSIINEIFALNILPPLLQMPDVINGFRSGFFRAFDFLENDISRFDNLEFSKGSALNASFMKRIVDQLEADPPRISIFDHRSRLVLETLLSRQEAARLKLLLCKHEKPVCDRRDIYLTEIGRTIQ